jgi:tetratricopeptide (TPR) repeat protein
MYSYAASNTSIQLAIGLNSEAAAMIENGNFESAIPKLTQALTASTDALQGFKKSRIQCFPEERVGMRRTPTSLDECMAASSQQSQADEPDQEEQGGGAHQYKYYVFRRCIPIPVSSTETTVYFESPMFIYVVIIFNLALAHQLSAMERHDVSESASLLLLSKAAQLYELVFNLQQEDECMENNALFSMATINNLALVYKSLDDSENAEKCFRYLLSILMLFVGCDGEQISGFEGFFRNTASHLVVFKDSSTRTAAAA